jgi:methylmalonyl-CoA/ethylmalonyl-CoA epimerase
MTSLDTGTPGSLHLAHTGYVVRNMATAIKRFKADGAALLVGPTDDPIQKVACALLALPGNVHLELVAPLGDDSPVQSRLARGGGLDHICYYADDLQTEIDREVAAGAVLVCPPTYAVTFGRDIAFVHRRSGLVVEFMSRHITTPKGAKQ